MMFEPPIDKLFTWSKSDEGNNLLKFEVDSHGIDRNDCFDIIDEVMRGGKITLIDLLNRYSPE